MQPSAPPKQAIAIARAKAKSRRQRVTQEPRPVLDVASEITKICLGTLFLVGMIFSTGALVTLAIVSIRCLIVQW